MKAGEIVQLVRSKWPTKQSERNRYVHRICCVLTTSLFFGTILGMIFGLSSIWWSDDWNQPEPAFRIRYRLVLTLLPAFYVLLLLQNGYYLTTCGTQSKGFETLWMSISFAVITTIAWATIIIIIGSVNKDLQIPEDIIRSKWSYSGEAQWDGRPIRQFDSPWDNDPITLSTLVLGVPNSFNQIGIIMAHFSWLRRSKRVWHRYEPTISAKKYDAMMKTNKDTNREGETHRSQSWSEGPLEKLYQAQTSTRSFSSSSSQVYTTTSKAPQNDNMIHSHDSKYITSVSYWCKKEPKARDSIFGVFRPWVLLASLGIVVVFEFTCLASSGFEFWWYRVELSYALILTACFATFVLLVLYRVSPERKVIGYLSIDRLVLISVFSCLIFGIVANGNHLDLGFRINGTGLSNTGLPRLFFLIFITVLTAWMLLSIVFSLFLDLEMGPAILRLELPGPVRDRIRWPTRA